MNKNMHITYGDNNNNSGIGFFGLLTIVFIALKLCDKIDWSWGWVLAPLWIPIVIACIVLLIILITSER